MDKPLSETERAHQRMASQSAQQARAAVGSIGTLASQSEVQAIVEGMRAYHRAGGMRPLEVREYMLRQMRSYLRSHEAQLFAALKTDLGKSEFESYATELGLVYEEIGTCLAHMAQWARPQRVATPLAHFPSSSCVYAQPMGVVCVMSPWNYPIQLALVPLVDALAAGNCVALKPSRTSAATNEFLKDLCETVFPHEAVYCFPSGSDMNDWLLATPFDKLFFTGSPRIGHVVMEAAAKHLCDVTLELGGKSPCIVDETADLKRAAQRIAWGKCINTGQTCVAPDYLLVHEDVAVDLVALLDVYLHRYYGEDILANEDYPHMINRHHFDRVCGLIDNHNPHAVVALGGGRDASTLKIEPTVLLGVTLNDPVMGEEIFGPVIPLITYRTLDEAFQIVRHFPSPLACYVFSEDRDVQQRVIAELPFGGGCINDVVVHLGNNHMGFGGFGNSGMGSYHGKAGFDCFTHYKSILKKSTLVEVPVRTFPTTPLKMSLLRLLVG